MIGAVERRNAILRIVMEKLINGQPKHPRMWSFF
jgi:hypothetical protein